MFRRPVVPNDAISPGLEVRLVPARILTQTGWIVGKLHVAENWRMIDYLNHAPEFFSLADVVLEGRPKVLPLFTLRRAAITFIVVETEEDRTMDLPARDYVVHQVAWLMQNGSLYGKIEIARSIRLSDYLSKARAFVMVRDAHFQLRNPWDKRVIDHREKVVLLNPHAAIGAAEYPEEE